MIEVSAKRRKYKFNVIDYLWYMGKDSERISQFSTPYKAVAWSIVIYASFLAGMVIASLCHGFSEVIIPASLIFGFIAYIRYEVYLEKHHFTKEREREYFRRYPERTHYSSWLLFIIPIMVIVLSLVLLGRVLVILSPSLK